MALNTRRKRSASHLTAQPRARRSALQPDDSLIFFPVAETSACLSPSPEVRRREPTGEDAGGARRPRPLQVRVKSPAVPDDLPKPIPPVTNDNVSHVFTDNFTGPGIEQ